MSKIKIEDLPVLNELNEKQSKGIFGGALMEPTISRDKFSLSTTSLSSPDLDRRGLYESKGDSLLNQFDSTVLKLY